MTIPMVQSLALKRFRSLRDTVVKLDNPTFLVGPNGAGKSNFVDAFSFLAEAMVSPLPAVFDRRGGVAMVTHRTSKRGRRARPEHESGPEGPGRDHGASRLCVPSCVR